MQSTRNPVSLHSNSVDQPSAIGTFDTVLPPASNMNRKALRKARKSAAKPVVDMVVSRAKDQKAHVDESSMEPKSIEDTIEYECCICGDDFPFSAGIAHCAEHFMCNSCVVDAYNAAITDTEAFPAQCCTPLPRGFVEHLLSPEIREAYALKAQEYYTPRAIRVYCVNEHCRSFIPKSRVEDTHSLFTVARCECGTDTCVGCKNRWEGTSHRCTDSESSGERPSWLPEYSTSCRVKLCPDCRVWMEHKEACNHMTCHYCRHEFCFVCLQPWTSRGFHEDAGCPSYGDPVQGYDAEGYELGRRGLHRDTGYDRQGLNRYGQRQLRHAVVDGRSFGEHDQYWDDEDLHHYDHEADHDDGLQWEDAGEAEWDPEDRAQYGDHWAAEVEWAPEDPAQHGDPWEDEVEAERDLQIENIDSDQVELPLAEAIADPATTGSEDDAAENEAASAPSTDEVVAIEAAAVVASLDTTPTSQRRPRPSPPSDLERQRIRLARRVPLLTPNPRPESRIFYGGTPSFQQLECSHNWHRKHLYETQYGYSHCLGCAYTANSWTNYCSTCGVVACDWCSYSFWLRYVPTWETAAGYVDVLIWAEEGVVPFKAAFHRSSEQQQDELWADGYGDCLGLATMVDSHEAQLFELQPYLYWDFGIQLMFGELELQMRREYCPVVEEDVGIPGLTLTFNLAANPFSPLCWDR